MLFCPHFIKQLLSQLSGQLHFLGRIQSIRAALRRVEAASHIAHCRHHRGMMTGEQRVTGSAGGAVAAAGGIYRSIKSCAGNEGDRLARHNYHGAAGAHAQVAGLAGGADGSAPCIRMGDFMEKNTPERLGTVRPSYPRGVRPGSLEAYLPPFITESLREGIRDFDAWMPGFYYPDALLTGVEARSTSPVRVLRGESGESTEILGLYPCGEGAGYAGGIVSSAADGVRMAMKYAEKCK